MSRGTWDAAPPLEIGARKAVLVENCRSTQALGFSPSEYDILWGEDLIAYHIEKVEPLPQPGDLVVLEITADYGREYDERDYDNTMWRVVEGEES